MGKNYKNDKKGSPSKNGGYSMWDKLANAGFKVPEQKPEQNPPKQDYSQRKDKSNSPQQDGKYVGAPYNFVPFSDRVFQYGEGELTEHSAMSEELITGEITYQITAKSPIFVDDENKEKPGFNKNAEGKYSIPGSTVRGLIRNNVQILGLSAFGEDVDSYSLMFRRVGAGKEVLDKQRYETLLGQKLVKVGDKQSTIIKNVKAGYIENIGGKYFLYMTEVDTIDKTTGDMNYYVLSERTIARECLKNPKKSSFRFFETDEGKAFMQNEIAEFERCVIKGRVHYIGKKNEDYSPDPYKGHIIYKLKGNRNIIAVEKYDEKTFQNKEKEGFKEGYMVGTGLMNEKKALYIIPKINKETSINLSEQFPEDIRAFQIDFNSKETSLKNFGGKIGKDLFALPEEGKIRPVFYFESGNHVYLGFTPRLRVYYDNSISDGLSKQHMTEKVDYARAIFGYSMKKDSYRSKVSFTDAVIEGVHPVNMAKSDKVILASPKPSSCLDYINPDKFGNGQSYNSPDFRLRGSKQYWLRKQTISSEKKDNEKVASAIVPLASGTKFTGKIRFQNLTENELGLLLWSIRLHKNSWMNIGKAKAYGYGNVKFEIKEVKKLNLGRAYAEDTLSLNPFDDIDIDDYIGKYKEFMNKWLGENTKIDDIPSVKAFFMMKDSSIIPDNSKTRYMSIDKKEYQNRTRPLPSVGAVCRKSD